MTVGSIVGGVEGDGVGAAEGSSVGDAVGEEVAMTSGSANAAASPTVTWGTNWMVLVSCAPLPSPTSSLERMEGSSFAPTSTATETSGAAAVGLASTAGPSSLM